MRLFRCVVAGTVGLLVGGASGGAMSFLFISTPLQRVLGPRYSEFDVFGVIGVTGCAALIASVAATAAAAQGAEKLRATCKARNLVTLVLAPLLIALVLTLSVSGAWAWLGMIHLAACLGVLAGARSGLSFLRTENTNPNDDAG